MKEIAIICLLPEEVNSYYLELREKLEDQFDLEMNHDVQAHITLKYGFPVEDIKEIETVAEQFVSSRPILKWDLQDFGNFNNPGKLVVFIDAIPSADTRIAHTALLDKLRKISWVRWSQFDASDLHYHVTLASKGITPKNFGKIWSFMNRLEKPRFEVQLDNLALFRIEKDPPFVQHLFLFPD